MGDIPLPMSPDPPTVAFYAPLKPVDHPVPSGDRTIARLMLSALTVAGFTPVIASNLRSFDRAGDGVVQATAIKKAEAEVERLAAGPAPRLWFTYHSYYKAPDLLGPVLARRWGIPYVVAEPSHAAQRLHGRWAAFARRNVAALQAADQLLWTTSRDLPALAALAGSARLRQLPAFLDPGPEPTAARQDDGPFRLLTVAMMRPGDKLASFRAMAAGLERVRAEFTLTIIGDGQARGEVEALLAPFAPRYLGMVEDREAIRTAYERASLLVWPGVGEGVGMLYLEAQAAGLPCLAEDRPAQRAVLAPSSWRVPVDDPVALAAAIDEAAMNLGATRARGRAAREYVLANHSTAAAAGRLREALWPFLGDML